MRLNEMKPGPGARKARKRVGRGTSSGIGKTCGRGVKGQKSREGGGIEPSFEGGQMPIHRRLPKFGFKSRKGRFNDEVRLDTLNAMGAPEVDLALLKTQGLVSSRAKRVKVIASGTLGRAVTVRGLAVTAGAEAAITAAGGAVEDKV